nr:MAG TPA: hypothetical protein [Herelleviridae sp.]
MTTADRVSSPWDSNPTDESPHPRERTQEPLYGPERDEALCGYPNLSPWLLKPV